MDRDIVDDSDEEKYALPCSIWFSELDVPTAFDEWEEDDYSFCLNIFILVG